MKDVVLLKRVRHLLKQAGDAISTSAGGEVRRSDYIGFLGASVSFIGSVYGTNHSYYLLFKANVNSPYREDIEQGISILEAIRDEINNGWLGELTGLIAAGLFADFLDMSNHLLEEGYKDAAAVMIGTVLEGHLRRVATSHNIPLNITNAKGDVIPQKAANLNTELTKASVYNSLDNKNVTAWLGLRNSAAHGKYADYTSAEVKLMLAGVMNFLSKVN